MQIKLAMKETAIAANKLEYVPFTATNGLYSAVVPKPEYVEKIMRLAEELELSPEEDALHATVIYSKATPPDKSNIEEFTVFDREHTAIINAVDSWVGHNGKTYIVLKLVSESIVMENAKYQRMGAEHTFIPFAPHLTLSDEVPVDAAMKARIAFVNKRLAFNPLEVVFTGQIAGDLT